MVNIQEDNNDSYSDIKNDYINLKLIFLSFIRNKKIIIFGTFLGILISGIYAFSQKKVYKGEFQIVINNSSSTTGLDSIDPRLVQFAGIEGGNKTRLETQVGILNSPSVLMDVFDFVKSKKAIYKDISNMRFKKWKKSNLKIDLKESTSILEITYKDTDKELVLPVLSMVSKEYQKYSGEKRLREINLGVDFFEKQIKIFNTKSIESLRKVQQFAIEQDLSILKDEALIDKDIINSINIEQIRVEAANRIRQIDEQLEQITLLKDDSDQIMYIAATIDSLDELALILKNIDSQLARLRLTYKDTDIKIKDLQKDRLFYIDLLKKQAIGYLISAKDDALAKLKSAERPPGVLIKYRQLLSNASKDKNTLDNLENQYRLLLLEKAKSKDPWKLITKPTLLPFHVAPKKKRILAFGLLSGLFTGFSISLIKDKKEDLILMVDDHNLFKGWTNLCSLPLCNRDKWKEEIELLSNGVLNQIKGGISFLYLGDISPEFLNEIENNFKINLDKLEIIKTKNILESTKLKNIIIIMELGITKKQDFLVACEKLKLQNNNLLGSIIITKNYDFF